MKKNVYEETFKEEPETPKDIYKSLNSEKKNLVVDNLQKVLVPEFKRLEKSIVAAIQDAKIKEITISNPPEKTEFPDVQKVKVTNPTDIPEIVFPEVQKVKVDNQIEIPEFRFPEGFNVENVNEFAQALADAIVFPKRIKADITNPTVINIPVGEGNDPKKTSPARYIPVRLTNGDRFYNALEDAYVAAAKTVFPFVNKNTGAPQPATVDDTGAIVTTASGSSGGGGVVTSVSGTLHTTVDNFPTVQNVIGQITPGVTTAVSGTFSTTTVSGLPGLNFPTVQTVVIENESAITTISGQAGVTLAVSGTITSVSGTNHATIDNFPTTQSVREQAPITTITTLSGSKTDVSNFPTVQTVNVQNQPNQTSVSGTFHAVVDNFPTIQIVKEQNPITSITTLSGSKIDVSNFPTYQSVDVHTIPPVTTASGSKTDISNFPTYQSVDVHIMPAITSVSGTFHSVIDNFPTIQSVTTLSGSQVAINNLSTVFPARLALADSMTNPTISQIQTFPMVYNNATWDRQINIAQAYGTFGQGISATGVSVESPIDFKYYNLFGYSPTRDAIAANEGYALHANAFGLVFNGTTWDRIRGDATNGMYARIAPGLTTAISGVVTSVSGAQNAVINNFPTVRTVNSPTPGNFRAVTTDTTDTLYSGVVPNNVLFAPIVASATGVTTVISGVANKVIKVISWGLMANAAVNIDWRSATTQKQLTGLFYLAANTGFSSGYSPKGHFQTEVGEPLGLELSGTVAVGGNITYILSQ